MGSSISSVTDRISGKNPRLFTMAAFPKNGEQKRPAVEGMGRKVLQGGLWVFVLRISSRGFGFIRTLILARLLLPEDFGLLGIAMLAVGTLETFSQTGVQAALIQRQEEDITSYLDTAWTVSVMRGMLLAILLFLSAPWIADFFGSPAACPIIRVVGITTLISGFVNSGIADFQRNIDFRRYFFYEFSGVITDLVLSLTLAFLLKSVWALVWSGLAANSARVVMSYILHPYRPRLLLDRGKWRLLFSFGRWVFASNVLIFLVTKGDDILVGKVLGTTALGFYQMAYLISNLPATEITHVISRVMFPTYARLQGNKNLLKEVYRKIVQLTAAISVPVSMGIFLMAHDFVNLFMGSKWLPMIPAIQVLSFAGMSRSLAATGGPVFYAVGKPNIDTILQFLRFLILAIIIYPLTLEWNIIGASISALASIFIAAIAFVLFGAGISDLPYSNLIYLMLKPISGATAMAFGILFLQILFPINSILSFSLSIFSGVFLYIGFMYIFNRTFFLEVFDIFNHFKARL